MPRGGKDRRVAADDGPDWSEIAVWYDDLVSGESGPHETAVQCLHRLLPDIRR